MQFFLKIQTATLELSQGQPTLTLLQIAAHDIIVGQFTTGVHQQELLPMVQTVLPAFPLPGNQSELMMGINERPA